MEHIIRFLFGKKVYFNDPILGEFETIIKSKHPSKEYTWISTHLLSEQKEETDFYLGGNVNGPFESQLKATKHIIADLQSIKDIMDKTLQLDTLEYKNLIDWKESFTLEAILFLNVSKKEFEVIFNSPIKEDNVLVSCHWTNGRIEKIGRV